MPGNYDFCGYATKNDLKCMDGRTIRKDAFKDCDGQTVPLVWGHKHDGPASVLGHALLENRSDGVYTYGVFNNTSAGKDAKELVRNGDIRALSIYANQLVQKGGDVLHGMIREVSLCLAGANPGARIEDISFEHSFEEDSDDFEAILFNGYNIENIELEHAAKEEPKEEKKEDNKEMATENEVKKTEAEDNEETVQDVWNTLNEKQKNVVYYMIGAVLEKQGGEDEEEETNMAHNVFENDTLSDSMAHACMTDALNTVVADAQKYGSLRKSYEHHIQEGGALAHAIDTTGMDVPVGNVTYGINGMDFMFPEARMLNNEIEFIKRNTDWVDVVLNGVHKSPFARVKSIFANITEDDARAKGYIKGNLKKEEFFKLIKRSTEPQTIYKKQKLDRDDITDITDFNVVNMIRGEMRLMLNEEVARAILIGDGRSDLSDEKIAEDKIRPIISDVPLFTIKAMVTPGADDDATTKNVIRAALRARKNYRGSGNPTLFTSDDFLTDLMLVEDGIGHTLYRTEAEAAAAMRVKNIITVPQFEGLKDGDNNDILGVIVNLDDYNVGTNRGGEVNMFDDFNIDYNQYIYLLETRCSGALTKPYSAIVLVKTNNQNNG